MKAFICFLHREVADNETGDGIVFACTAKDDDDAYNQFVETHPDWVDAFDKTETRFSIPFPANYTEQECDIALKQYVTEIVNIIDSSGASISGISDNMKH